MITDEEENRMLRLIVSKHEGEMMNDDVAQGCVVIGEFVTNVPRPDLWPLPFKGPRRFTIDPPLVVHFRVLVEPPADSDLEWNLPCVLGEFDPDTSEGLEREDFPYPVDYSDRTGGTRAEVVDAITEHIGFHYQIAESEAFYGGSIDSDSPADPEDVAQARADLDTYWQRVKPVDCRDAHGA